VVEVEDASTGFGGLMRGHAAVTRAPHQPASIEELDLDEPRDTALLLFALTHVAS
jgi:hypothetical protein